MRHVKQQGNMADPDIHLDLYKIPSIEILRNRQIFYGLWRRSDDKTRTWLDRVESSIRHCDFPTIIVEFLLLDRFVCGLSASELSSIQIVKESWTLIQLLEHFFDGNVDIGHIKTDSVVNNNSDQNQNPSIAVVKSEPVRLTTLA